MIYNYSNACLMIYTYLLPLIYYCMLNLYDCQLFNLLMFTEYLILTYLFHILIIFYIRSNKYSHHYQTEVGFLCKKIRGDAYIFSNNLIISKLICCHWEYNCFRPVSFLLIVMLFSGSKY